MTAYRIRLEGKVFFEETYRFSTKDLGAAVRYLSDVVGDLREAGIDDSQITVRAELDAAPYGIEIEVYATDRQATTLGWTLPADDEDDAAA